MEVLERLTPYVELVHLLLNTNFTYLTRKLAPSDSLDRCCFSKRMRKVFKKNEKSMLQFCNKNSKKKRAFTMG